MAMSEDLFFMTEYQEENNSVVIANFLGINNAKQEPEITLGEVNILEERSNEDDIMNEYEKNFDRETTPEKGRENPKESDAGRENRDDGERYKSENNNPDRESETNGDIRATDEREKSEGIKNYEDIKTVNDSLESRDEKPVIELKDDQTKFCEDKILNNLPGDDDKLSREINSPEKSDEMSLKPCRTECSRCLQLINNNVGTVKFKCWKRIEGTLETNSELLDRIMQSFLPDNGIENDFHTSMKRNIIGQLGELGPINMKQAISYTKKAVNIMNSHLVNESLHVSILLKLLPAIFIDGFVISPADSYECQILKLMKHVIKTAGIYESDEYIDMVFASYPSANADRFEIKQYLELNLKNLLDVINVGMPDSNTKEYSRMIDILFLISVHGPMRANYSDCFDVVNMDEQSIFNTVMDHAERKEIPPCSFLGGHCAPQQHIKRKQDQESLHPAKRSNIEDDREKEIQNILMKLKKLQSFYHGPSTISTPAKSETQDANTSKFRLRDLKNLDGSIRTDGKDICSYNHENVKAGFKDSSLQKILRRPFENTSDCSRKDEKNDRDEIFSRFRESNSSVKSKLFDQKNSRYIEESPDKSFSYSKFSSSNSCESQLFHKRMISVYESKYQHDYRDSRNEFQNGSSYQNDRYDMDNFRKGDKPRAFSVERGVLHAKDRHNACRYNDNTSSFCREFNEQDFHRSDFKREPHHRETLSTKYETEDRYHRELITTNTRHANNTSYSKQGSSLHVVDHYRNREDEKSISEHTKWRKQLRERWDHHNFITSGVNYKRGSLRRGFGRRYRARNCRGRFKHA